MNTLTDLELYKLAYDSLLQRWAREQEINERTLKELGRENTISLHRIAKINPQLAELHDKILELEKEGK